MQKETRLRLVLDDALRLTGGRWRAGASFHKGSFHKGSFHKGGLWARKDRKPQE